MGSPAPGGAAGGQAVVVQMPLTPSPDPPAPASRVQLLTPPQQPAQVLRCPVPPASSPAPPTLCARARMCMLSGTGGGDGAVGI